MSSIKNLPLAPLDVAAQQHSEKMMARILAEIKTSGQITFARYMELALYAPGLGYYSAGAKKFGRHGDFVTAPEISPLFAKTLAKQFQPILQTIKNGNILELGAGTGMMAADILLELAKRDQLPAHYYILEVSADLKDRQQETIKSHCPLLSDRVIWLTELPLNFEGIIVANEVMDSMPVHRFRLNDHKDIQELYVRSENNELIWYADVPSEASVTEYINSLKLPYEDYESEINLFLPGWIKSLSGCLQKGIILLIDYGFPRHEFYHPDRNRGTLMCHYRHHAHSNPLIFPGMQDITAHVDFTQVAECANDAGLDVDGYTSQAAFLIGGGLQEFVELETDVKKRFAITNQIKILTLPSEMGELFKVIALSRKCDHVMTGFSLQDRRGRL